MDYEWLVEMIFTHIAGLFEYLKVDQRSSALDRQSCAFDRQSTLREESGSPIDVTDVTHVASPTGTSTYGRVWRLNRRDFRRIVAHELLLTYNVNVQRKEDDQKLAALAASPFAPLIDIAEVIIGPFFPKRREKRAASFLLESWFPQELLLPYCRLLEKFPSSLHFL